MLPFSPPLPPKGAFLHAPVVEDVERTDQRDAKRRERERAKSKRDKHASCRHNSKRPGRQKGGQSAPSFTAGLFMKHPHQQGIHMVTHRPAPEIEPTDPNWVQKFDSTLGYPGEGPPAPPTYSFCERKTDCKRASHYHRKRGGPAGSSAQKGWAERNKKGVKADQLEKCVAKPLGCIRFQTHYHPERQKSHSHPDPVTESLEGLPTAYVRREATKAQPPPPKPPSRAGPLLTNPPNDKSQALPEGGLDTNVDHKHGPLPPRFTSPVDSEESDPEISFCEEDFHTDVVASAPTSEENDEHVRIHTVKKVSFATDLVTEIPKSKPSSATDTTPPNDKSQAQPEGGESATSEDSDEVSSSKPTTLLHPHVIVRRMVYYKGKTSDPFYYAFNRGLYFAAKPFSRESLETRVNDPRYADVTPVNSEMDVAIKGRRGYVSLWTHPVESSTLEQCGYKFKNEEPVSLSLITATQRDKMFTNISALSATGEIYASVLTRVRGTCSAILEDDWFRASSPQPLGQHYHLFDPMVVLYAAETG